MSKIIVFTIMGVLLLSNFQPYPKTPQNYIKTKSGKKIYLLFKDPVSYENDEDGICIGYVNDFTMFPDGNRANLFNIECEDENGNSTRTPRWVLIENLLLRWHS